MARTVPAASLQTLYIEVYNCSTGKEVMWGAVLVRKRSGRKGCRGSSIGGNYNPVQESSRQGYMRRDIECGNKRWFVLAREQKLLRVLCTLLLYYIPSSAGLSRGEILHTKYLWLPRLGIFYKRISPRGSIALKGSMVLMFVNLANQGGAKFGYRPSAINPPKVG